MSSRRVAKVSLAAAIAVMVLSVGGFTLALVLDAFVLDRYNAYGEVPVPGSGSLHLPAGDVTVSLHTVVISGPDRGLPVPPLGVTIAPPDGVPQPVLTESIGTTTTVNNDAHVRVWVARIAADGTYTVTTDGRVNGYINPRLAFGHKSSARLVVWLFVATFVVGLIGSLLAGRWLSRTRRRAVAAAAAANPYPWAPAAPTAHEPTDEGVRVERLKTIAALRDSGTLTQEEFEAEKRRILEGR